MRHLFLSLCLFLTGCDALRDFVSGPPPPVPLVVDILLDASLDSSASPATATSTITMAAHAVADRPGSVIRCWLLGASVMTTRVVSTAVVPAPSRSGKRSREAARDAFLRERLPALIEPVLAALKEPPPRRTPLVQSLLLIAMADAPPHVQRHILACTDMKESELFPEASRPPSVQRVNELLHATDCPTRLAGIKVTFVYCSLRASTNPRCNLTVIGYEELRRFWTDFISHAGGTATFYNELPDTID